MQEKERAFGEFADAVRRLREERGLSLRACKALTGVAHPTLRVWEEGETQPRLSSVKAFITGLGLDASEWLTLAGYPVNAASLLQPCYSPTSRSAASEVNLAVPAVPDAVRAAIEREDTREGKVSVAFAYLCRPELDLRLGADAMTRQTTDAQLAIVRVYERLTGVVLLPPEVV